MNFPHFNHAHIFRIGLCFLCLLPLLLTGQVDVKTMYDGPYVFVEGDSLRVQWVDYGVKHDSLIPRSEASVFAVEGLPVVDLANLELPEVAPTTFSKVEKVVAMSDVHGQYDIMVELLHQHGVIDEEGHWALGKGHLVIIGDNMDRGEKVTEILWTLFFLQKEAAAAGGRVNVLTGNHELMVMHGDLRYLNKKYVYTAAFFATPYADFYRPGSILGDWLRRQNVMARINDELYVHAGISSTLVQLGHGPEEINRIFREKILSQTKEEVFADDELYTIYGDDGPVWYRGYFNDPEFTREQLAAILKTWGLKRMIVGHTSQPKIEGRYDGLLLVIDCSIKLGDSGQLLVIEPDGVYTGDLSGERTLLPEATLTDSAKVGLFDYLFYAPERPKIHVSTNVNRMISRSDKEEYQEATVSMEVGSANLPLVLKGRVRARGNMRKQVCYFPPLKLDFNKSNLDSLGFSRLDKIKLVLPCKSYARSQQLLYKEHLIYQLYDFIDTNSIRTRLVDVVLNTGEEDRFVVTGMLVEDEETYAKRKNAMIVEKGFVTAGILERDSWTKVRFFQYMIANTDWSVHNRHNLELVRFPDRTVVAVPYDFDYSGMVGQGYAVPHPSLPIKDVQERYFKKNPITAEEFDKALAYYLEIESDLYGIVDDAPYFDEKARKECRRYLEKFFDVLRKPKRMRKQALAGGEQR